MFTFRVSHQSTWCVSWRSNKSVEILRCFLPCLLCEQPSSLLSLLAHCYASLRVTAISCRSEDNVKPMCWTRKTVGSFHIFKSHSCACFATHNIPITVSADLICPIWQITYTWSTFKAGMCMHDVFVCIYGTEGAVILNFFGISLVCVLYNIQSAFLIKPGLKKHLSYRSQVRPCTF